MPFVHDAASSTRCLGNGSIKIKNALETYYAVKIETNSNLEYEALYIFNTWMSFFRD